MPAVRREDFLSASHSPTSNSNAAKTYQWTCKHQHNTQTPRSRVTFLTHAGKLGSPRGAGPPPGRLPLVPSGLLRGALCNPKSFKRRPPTTGNLSETWEMNLARRRRKNPTDVKHPFSAFGLWLPLRLALCLCRLHRPLFFVVSGMLHTSSPKRPARAADCFLTHISETDPAPARHQLSPQIPPADTDPAPAAPPRPFLQSGCCSCHQPHRARTKFGRNPVPGFCSCPAPDLVGRGPFRPKSCSRTTDLVGRDFPGRNHMCMCMCMHMWFRPRKSRPTRSVVREQDFGRKGSRPTRSGAGHEQNP